jgi:hypothetical protein
MTVQVFGGGGDSSATQSLGTKSANFIVYPGSGDWMDMTLGASVTMNITNWGGSGTKSFYLRVIANAVYTLTLYTGETGTTAINSSSALASTISTSGATNKVDILKFTWDPTASSWTFTDAWFDVRNA